METIDLRRDPCAEAIAIALAASTDEAATPLGEQGTSESVVRFVLGRERPVKYVQHPSYVRFLRPDTLAA